MLLTLLTMNHLQKELDETGVRVIRVEGSEPNSLLSKHGTIKLPSEFIRKTFNRLSQIFFIPDNKIILVKKALLKNVIEILSENILIVFLFLDHHSVSLMYLADLKKYHNIPIVS